MPGRQIVKSYDYLRSHAGKTITFGSFQAFTGWAKSTLDIYLSKKFKEFLVEVSPPGTPQNNREFYVNRSILRVGADRYYDSFRQKNWVYSKFKETEYQTVKIYDFFLPLTNENLLRQNLDELFYRDTLYKRFEAINLTDLEPIYPMNTEESGSDYFDRLTLLASDLFWGYSISHVSGRFRTENTFLSRTDAAKVEGKSYLIDETTAIVRFIFPYEDGKHDHHDKLDRLFILLFVKAITEATPDEDEILLLESFGNNVLHKYSKVPWG